MRNGRLIRDKLSEKVMSGLTWLSILMAFFIGWGLYSRSLPLLRSKPLFSLISSGTWKPFKGEFGFFPFIMGTAWVTAIAILLALPLGLLCSIYLSEYSGEKVRRWMVPLVDLLAGIPSVVYGLWATLAIVPLIRNYLSPYFVKYSSGYSVLAGGMVLSIMLLPFIISVTREVFYAVPDELREASLSLGATLWQTMKHTVLRKSLPGIVAVTVLAVSRALGETMAVLMVCGNVAQAPHSPFDPGYPLPALIANNYGEMLSIPLYDSALLLAAFLLFLIVLCFNAASRLILFQLERRLY